MRMLAQAPVTAEASTRNVPDWQAVEIVNDP